MQISVRVNPMSFEINSNRYERIASQVLHRKPGSNDPMRIVLQAESSDVMRRWIDYLEDVKMAATRRSVENQLDTFLGRTWCSSTKRENFNHFNFTMIQSYRSNHKNVTCITHLYYQKITPTPTLKCPLKCYEKL